MPSGFTMSVCPTCGKPIYARGFSPINRPRHARLVKKVCNQPPRHKVAAKRGATLTQQSCPSSTEPPVREAPGNQWGGKIIWQHPDDPDEVVGC
jgi:hypothetical protein